MKRIRCAVVIVIAMLVGCLNVDTDASSGIDITYRNKMRKFVQDLASYAGTYNKSFLIIAQNGQELVTDNGQGDGIPQTAYLRAIDATGREDMFYGYDDDDEETPAEDRKHMLSLCLVCKQNNVEVLVTDYCSTHSKMDHSYQINRHNGFISFAAPDRELRVIPDYPAPIFNENDENIIEISQAKNFLYLINSENFVRKQDVVNAVSATNYDIIIMDLYHNETAFTQVEIEQLKNKKNGGKRLVICYMSIGEAESYRYYWQKSWNSSKPDWLESENSDWQGNYKVKYWVKAWQNIIFGNDDSYLKKIIDAGFDGVYLDIVDAFEFFE